MLTSEGVIDGSFDINIYVTDLKISRTVKTRCDVHIGGLMLKLVQTIEEPSKDWSDHGIWWPEKNSWLVRTRRTLDQYGVYAGSTLHFTPMHRNIQVILPDLQTRELRLNFSANVFNNVIAACKNLGIRHPEELSLMLTTDRKSQRRSVNIQATPHRPTADTSSGNNQNAGSQSHERTPGTASADIVLGRSMDNLLFDANDSTTGCKTASLDSMTSITSLAASPLINASQAVKLISRTLSYADKAKLNSRWLDSSLSLMEQQVEDSDTIMLQYKFCVFFDLNPKYDAVRINQIYEQAKWSLICEHVNCSEEEMIFFAGLHLHIQRLQQSSDSQAALFLNDTKDDDDDDSGGDDIGAALDSLQMSLTGDVGVAAPTASCPILRDHHLFLKPKKFSLNHYKKQYFVLRDGSLTMFNSGDDENSASPILSVSLRGCDVRGEAKVAQEKFLIKLTILGHGTSTECWIRIATADKYAEWLAAMRLYARRRTIMASGAGSYASEVQSVLEVLRLRQTSASAAVAAESRNDDDVNPEDFVSNTVLRKLGRRQVMKQLKEACHSVQAMSLSDAKLTFIKTWQNLPECGYAYFVISFKGSKKKDFIGIGVQQMAQLDMNTGQCLRTWTYDVMTSWSVNWNIEQVKIEISGAQSTGDTEVAFKCLSANCKIVHEFIGGYVFLAMRSLDKCQTLNEELFQKLTGGWI